MPRPGQLAVRQLRAAMRLPAQDLAVGLGPALRGRGGRVSYPSDGATGPFEMLRLRHLLKAVCWLFGCRWARPWNTAGIFMCRRCHRAVSVWPPPAPDFLPSKRYKPLR